MKRLLFIILGCATMSACWKSVAVVDLSDVQNFSKQINGASATVAQMPDDYVASCNTMLEYEGESRLGTLGTGPRVRGRELITRPIAALPLPPTTPPSPTPTPGQTPTPKNNAISAPQPSITPGPTCESIEKLANRWRKLNNAVFYYVKGLGDVAGVDTAPSEKKYKDLADQLASDKLLKPSVAGPAATFVAALGHHIIHRQQERAIADLVSLSQQDGILNKILQVAEESSVDAHSQLVSTKSAVDNRYSKVIASEVKLLRALRLQARLNPDPGSSSTSPALPRPGYAPPLNARAISTKLVPLCKSQSKREQPSTPRAAEPCRAPVPLALAVQIETLRFNMLQQRADWTRIDQDIKVQDDRIRAYFKTMYDIGQINDKLVQQKSGFQGLIAAIKPWIDDLGDQTSALIGAATAKSSAKP